MREILKQKEKAVDTSRSVCEDDSNICSNSLRSLSEEEPHRRSKRGQRPLTNSCDSRVEILEFKGKLDPDEFVERLGIVKQIFEYKEILEGKKIKLVAFRLRPTYVLNRLETKTIRLRLRRK